MVQISNQTWEIKLGCGVNSILFGQTEKQVIALLGKPDKSFITGYENKRLQFNELLIELSFEHENDNRLGWIEVHNTSFTLFGYHLIGKRFTEILAILNTELQSEYVIEDYGSFVSLTYEKEWLELQFSFGKLTNINFGVLFNNKGEPEWPAT